MPTKRLKPDTDDLRPEYDLTALKGGVRGKYYRQAIAAKDEPRLEYRLDYRQSRPNRFAPKPGETRVAVVLEPDVARAFRSARSVNQALRSAMSKARRSATQPAKRRRPKG